jgi:hypothetical protein
MLPFGALIAACGGDDDDDIGDPLSPSAGGSRERQVEQAIQSALDAYNAGDVNTFLSYWTDEGLREEFGASRQQILASPDEYLGGPPRTVRDFSDTSVRNDSAFTKVEFAVGKAIQREDMILLLQSGAWKINASTQAKVDIPGGTDAIDVDLDEFSFEFDASDIKDGNIAFKADNVGDQPHELVLVKVPANFSLSQLLDDASGAPPADVEILGYTMADPGEEANLVFTEDLAAGRYLMVCFLPDTQDPQQTPHAAKGMLSEFNIAAEGGGR